MQEINAIDRSQLPADIRTASTKDQQNYAAAQQFEQMLVQKMLTQTSSLMGADGADGADDGSGDTGDGADGLDAGSSSTDAVSAHYKELLPELMAKAMVTGDGVGIARDLYDAMKQQQ